MRRAAALALVVSLVAPLARADEPAPEPPPAAAPPAAVAPPPSTPPAAPPPSVPAWLEAAAQRLEEEHAAGLILRRRLNKAVLGFGAISTGAGVALLIPDAADQSLRVAGGVTLAFGVIDAALAVMGLYGLQREERAFAAAHAQRRTPSGLAKAMLARLRAEHLEGIAYGINLGLDVFYLGGGIGAIVASQLGADHPDRWLAAGIAATIQAVFLLGVDTAGVLFARRGHARVLDQLAPLLGVTQTAAGPELRVGLAGTF